MSKRIFTKDQVIELSKNKNVTKCSEKSITYSKDFKRIAIKQYNEQGLTSSKIFRLAGFDLEMIGRDIPAESLRRWNRTYRMKGIEKLSIETRGNRGRPVKVKDATDKDKIKRLETEVAYLKAENDFLAKLRAKRRE
jgi:transposase-like protein